MKPLILALVLAIATGAHAATLTATPANVGNTVWFAKPGDVVQLQTGSYGVLNMLNVKQVAPGVTITPAPGAVVSLTGIQATNAANLIFDGLEVAMTPTTQYGAQAAGSTASTFRNMKVHQADNQTLGGIAFFLRNAHSPTIDANDISWAGGGITIMDSDHATVTNNTVHDIQNDVIDLAGAPYALVKGNTGTNSHPATGQHPDFIQFFKTAATPNPCGMDIENNRFDRGTGGISQGIFGEDGCNVTIKGNILRGTMYNGIGLARTQGAVISGNFLDGYPDMATQIIVRGGCDSVQITGNATQGLSNYTQAGEAPCTNVTISGNTTLKPAAFGDDTVLNGWLHPVVNPLQATVDALTAQLKADEDRLAKVKAALQ